MKPEVTEVKLEDRDAATAWIAKNQLGRRNLTDIARIELARVLRPEIEKRAKENEKAGGGSGSSGRKKSANPTKTRDALAKEAGLSHDTFRKGEYILDNADEETIEIDA